MKKVFSILAIAAFVFAAHNAKAQLGFNIGYAPETTTTETTVGNSTTTTTSDVNGFFAGINFNKEISGNLCLSVGAQARLNMESDEATVLTVTTKTNSTQILLDVPILFNYGFPLGNSLKFNVFVGPMVSYALYGNTKTKTHESLTNVDIETDADWYDDNSNNERLNLSGAAGITVDFNEFRLFGGYRLGFLDLNKSDNVKSTNSGLFFGLGMTL